MSEYLVLLKVFFLSWMIVRFEPLGWILDLLPKGLPKYLLIVLTTCLKCSNFWLGLILTGDIFISSGLAFIGMLYEKTIGKWETTIKFN
jgi:hypothetical protein